MKKLILFFILLVSMNCLLEDSPIVFTNTDWKQVQCMAVNTWMEARGEPYDGKVAVNEVVLNRSQKYKLSPCEVIQVKKAFSWTNETHHRVRQKALQEANNQRGRVEYQLHLEVASRVFLGLEDSRLSGNTRYYHSLAVKPIWRYSLKRDRVIGRHIFYSDVKFNHRTD